jgi:hypothetical protein
VHAARRRRHGAGLGEGSERAQVSELEHGAVL